MAGLGKCEGETALKQLSYRELIHRLALCFKPKTALPILRELRRRYAAQGRRKHEPGMLPSWEEFCRTRLQMSPRTVRHWLQDATSGRNCRRLDARYVASAGAKRSRTSRCVLSAHNYRASFPNYPPLVDHELGIYGVWCLRPANSDKGLWGMYPRGFLERALSLFADAHDVLHLPSGALHSLPAGHVKVDLVRDHARHPHVQADAKALPFADCSFDLVLSDPPYTPADAEKYGTPVFPEQKFLAEAWRVLRVGGYLAVLHKYEMQVPIARLKRVALIAVSLGNHKELRTFAIYQRV